MIVYIKTIGKDSLEKNISLICIKESEHKVIDWDTFKKGTSCSDNTKKLIIIGHGSIDHIGGVKSAELARAIQEYISQLAERKKHIDEIELAACNTGKTWKNTPPFAQQIADELCKLLKVEQSIQIKAPNGILVFYSDGTREVLKDDDPLAYDKLYMEKIKNTQNHDPTKQRLQSWKEKDPWYCCAAISFSHIVKTKKNIKVHTQNEHKSNIGSEEIMIPNTLYNRLTFLYAVEAQTETNLIDKQNSEENSIFCNIPCHF